MQPEEVDHPQALFGGVTFRVRMADGKTTICRITRDGLQALSSELIREPDECLDAYRKRRIRIVEAAGRLLSRGIRKPLLTAADFQKPRRRLTA